jgi:hypothetical protein
MADDPLYIASAQTAQKTQLPTVLLLLGDVASRADRTENIVTLLRVQFLLL